MGRLKGSKNGILHQVEIVCLNCGKINSRYPSLGISRYCNNKCYGEHKKITSLGHFVSEETKKKISSRNSGVNNGMYRKIPYNKGLKYPGKINQASFVIGTTPWNKGLKWIAKQNENNPNWKGDNVGDKGLHGWVRRYNGPPKICEFCGSKNNLQWANKSQEYKRDLSDWLSLCSKCHKKYDMGKIKKLRYRADKPQNT